MYLSQIPTTPGIHLLGIADLSPTARAREPGAARLEARGHRRDVVRRGAQARQHLSHRGLAGAGQPSRDRHHRRIRRAIRSPPSSMRWKPSGTARAWSMVTVEADAFCGPLLAQTRCRSRRDLQPRLRRPAGADLRAGRLGAHLGLRGDGGRARPQVAAALRAIDARDRLEILGPQRGAGQARRPESQDVQLLPRRLQARDREHGRRQCHRPHAGAGRSRLPTLFGGGPAVRDAAQVRGRPPAPQGPGRGRLVAREVDGRAIPYEIRKGVWVVFEANTDYQKNCFEEYMLCTDPSGRYFGDVQALAPDRPGSRHVGGLDRPAQGTDGLRDRLPRRRDRDRQARPQGGRDAGRRGRLHGLRQALPVGEVDHASAACRSASRTM